MAYKGLGRGLDALLADNNTKESGGVTVVRISEIEPNLKQVRKQFDPESLAELASSIKEHGLIQPIVVRKSVNGFYEIVAGERRWRASKLAGLTEVPVIVKELDNEAASLIAMVENLQREDLNPVEEAAGYRSLMDNFGMTQEEAASKVGRSRSAVANIMRLLTLPEGVLSLVRQGDLSGGHARTLIPLSDIMTADELTAIAESVTADELSVRETEKLVKKLLENKENVEKPSKVKDVYYKQLESKASSVLGRRMAIKVSPTGKGKITLAYSSPEDLENLLISLCGKNFFDKAGE